jgi:hypothetical protein
VFGEKLWPTCLKWYWIISCVATTSQQVTAQHKFLLWRSQPYIVVKWSTPWTYGPNKKCPLFPSYIVDKLSFIMLDRLPLIGDDNSIYRSCLMDISSHDTFKPLQQIREGQVSPDFVQRWLTGSVVGHWMHKRRLQCTNKWLRFKFFLTLQHISKPSEICAYTTNEKVL